jgi:glycosyltransferase involved in cell wall biosynthesis
MFASTFRVVNTLVNLGMSDSSKSLILFLPDYGDGGLERMFVNLASQISLNGVRVYFIVCDASRPYLDDLNSGIELIVISKDRLAITRELVSLLEQYRATSLLTAKGLGLAVALNAKRQSSSDTRIYLRAITNISARIKHRHLLQRIKGELEVRKLRKLYHQLDGIVAVSYGIAEDVHCISGIPLSQIKVAHNPVVTKQLHQRAGIPVDHPWLLQHEIPVIMGIGRLTKQKNFELLINAFALVRDNRPVKLIILGGGSRKKKLIKQAERLGVADDVDLPGFNPNPYSMLHHASLFVLSSNWEGSPNVLTEALAVGCPAISTDCPSGPGEILREGKYGPLVPMNDIKAMAGAIMEVLDNPLPREVLQSATEKFTVENSAREYIQALELSNEQ